MTDDEPTSMSWRDRALLAVVPVLLIAVAVTQVVRTQTVDQSSWYGTGFGMFATLDTYRHVRAWTVPGNEPLPVPGDRAAREARIVPSEANAMAVARTLAASEDASGADAVRVEVRRLEASWSDGRVEVEVTTLVAVEHDVGPASAGAP